MRQPLSPLETIMWRIGRDASLRTTIGTLLILDGPPDREALGERLAATVERTPRLRSRPVDVPVPALRPVWEVMSALDVDDLVRHVDVGAPGEPRQVLDLVTLLEAMPLEPHRPLWDVTVIGGLEGGRAAVYLRAHHVVADGFGGLSLLGLLLDDAAASPSATPVAEANETTSTDDRSTAGRPTPDGRRPGTVTVTVDLASALRPLSAGLDAARRVDPRRAGLRQLRRGIDLASSLSRQVVAGTPRRSSLPTSPIPTSHYEILSVPGARRSAIALGGSRNDLVVAASAMGLGRYLERMGQPTDEVCLVSPVRHAHRGGTPNNRFAPVLVIAPAASTHPVPQFGVVVERLSQARKEPALPIAAALAPAISRLPTRALASALHAELGAVDFVATALPGLRGTRRLCGRVVEESYPFGPRLGCPMNVTGFGNGSRLDVGITLSPTVFPDPEMLRDCLADAFADLTQAGS